MNNLWPRQADVSAISQINATQFTADLLDMSSAAST